MPSAIEMRKIAAAAFLCGLAASCFIAGAAVMHLKLPTSDYLSKAFEGADAWMNAAPPRLQIGDPAQAEVVVDRKEKTADGFTAFTTTQAPWASLIDMRGTVVRFWKVPSDLPLETVEGVRRPADGEPRHLEKCHVYPNGDLLALVSSNGGSPYGFCLAKLDKDSKVRWTVHGNFHHCFGVAADGRIAAVVDRAVEGKPSADWLPISHVADDLLIFSPDGEKLASVPLIEAFEGTPYEMVLHPANEPQLPGGMSPPSLGVMAPMLPPVMHGIPSPPPDCPPTSPPPTSPPLRPSRGPFRAGLKNRDALHTNSIQFLGPNAARLLPMLKPGQVLLSFRSPHAIAVVDLETRKAVWAARGVWRSQHDAQMLESGRILLFDNLGSALGARALEYDPATQAAVWHYGGNSHEAFTNVFRGGVQRLRNGNTLIVDASGRKAFEVTPEKEIVWNFHCSAKTSSGPLVGDDRSEQLSFTSARRYQESELPFLGSEIHARPK